MQLHYWAFVFLTLLLTAGLSYSTYATTRLLRTWQPLRNPLLEPAEMLVRVVLIVVCIGLGWFSGLPMATLGLTAPRLLIQLGAGLLVGIVLAGLLILATRWLVMHTGQRFYSTTLLDLIVPRTRRELAPVLVAMAFVVAVEELLFRSLLIGGLSPLAPQLLLVLLVGLLFGLLHSAQGAWGMVGASAAGIILGALFVTSGSLVLPLVTHYVVNAVQLTYAMCIERPGQRGL